MAAKKCRVAYPSGLFIPVEKQSLFMVVFEDMLITSYELNPFFGPQTTENSCEIKFNNLGDKLYNPSPFMLNLKKAIDFIRENLNILEDNKMKKRRSKSKSSLSSPQVVHLDDARSVKTVDSTVPKRDCPEVIVLEDSFVDISGDNLPGNSGHDVVDLTSFSEISQTPHKRRIEKEEVQVLNLKRFTPNKIVSPSSSVDEIKIVGSTFKLKKIRSISKKKKNLPSSEKKSKVGSKKRKKSVSSLRTESCISVSSTDSLPPRKKRKLQDIGNIQPTASCSISPSPKQLSDNTLKYYENIAKVFDKTRNKSKKSPARKILSLRIHSDKDGRKVSPTSSNSLREKCKAKHQRKLLHRVLHNPPSRVLTPRRSLRQRIMNSNRCVGEVNVFNPNPCLVDVEGLRPIVIDGSNVAIGHGRGKFSTRGLKICVDYFAAKGHTNIKVFLPKFRQEHFSTELLDDLKAKCDVVFTPSQCINGQRRTPYDDRFIVQYATEFGGVIVSTDNYRDLLRENPRWQDTILKRLLMFTWVDDFLMFPMDPLGRTGPTLEEFLRF